MTSEVLTRTTFAGLPIEKPQGRAATVNMLVYGDSSVGKTTLVGSCDTVPEMRKVLFVDIEKGDLSLRKTDYRPDVVRVNNWVEFGRIYEALKAGGHGYNTVAVDSLTEVNDLSVKQIMTEMADDESETPEWKHWNINSVRMLRMLRNWRDLPMNVVFTALAKEEESKSGKRKILPDLTGKLGSRVPAIFDNVFYFYTKELVENNEPITKRLLLTTKTENTVAKNRGSDDLQKLIEVPTTPIMNKIYNGILGGN